MLKILTNRYFWIGVGFLLLLALSLLVGAWMEWSLVTRLFIVIGLLGVGLGVVTVEFIRARRNAQKIEQSITMQAEGQREEARPDKQAEIDELEDRLEEAIATLKESKLGRGRHSQNALHALPWYMFVGPSGAGKTTAIKNSGLNFPMGAEGVRGVGGTRNCDWFFSDQAILLDTAGRYMTEKEDEPEWHAFLEMLKERRKHRPINGVIVGISVDELVEASPEQIEWHADNIRRRISELVEKLEVQFPVYLVFTKCDLLKGFVEFFEDRPRSEREKIWGATLTDEQQQESPRTLFDKEFDLLYESLVDERVDRLKRVANPEKRRRVYAFPLELAAAKENLSLFVEQLFQENPYQENPEFRGFYFTSGTQEGSPIDRVLQSMSEEADLAPDGHPDSETETKSYFINNLFTDVVVPDQYRVSQTSSSVRRGRFLRWGVGAVSALLLGVFILFAGQAVVRSEMSLAHVEDVAQKAAAIQWERQPSVQNLETIDQLRSALVRLERYAEDPPLLRWGFYRSGVVLDPARNLFVRKMRPLVRNQFQHIERTLRRSTAEMAGTLGPDRQLEMRETLRAYLLLSEEVQRLGDEQERVFLKRHLTSVATRDSGRGASAAKLDQRSGQVESQIARYVDQLSEERAASFQAESALIQDVRQMIYRKPTVGNLYAEIRQKGTNSLRPLRLSSIVQDAALLFSTRPEVPGFFTKKGWNSYVEERIEAVAQNPGKGGWVLGNQSAQLSGKLKKEEKIIEQLRERYFEDYATAWTNFLRRVEYRSFARDGRVARALNTLGDRMNSPILHLLARVTAETDFAASMSKKAKGMLEKEAEVRAQAKARRRTRSDVGGASGEESTAVHPVTREFMGLHQLKAGQAAGGKTAAELTRALGALGRVGRTMDTLSGSPDKATETAKRILNGDSGLRSALTTIRNGLTRIDGPVRRHLFEAPILNAWTEILQTAQKQLNQKWQRDVYRPYQKNLEGRYPFEAGSEDASLADVERFFSPQKGIVASFRRKELSPFLKEGRLKPKTWEGHGIRLSSSTKAFFDAVDRIGEALMGSGGLRLRFKLAPELPKKEGDVPAPSLLVMQAHGTSQTYEMGHQPETVFTWPGPPKSRLVLDTRGTTFTPKQKKGAWAWFRLLEEASVEPRGPGMYRVRWTFKKGRRNLVKVRYDLRSQANQRLFTDPVGFFRFSVPEKL